MMINSTDSVPLEVFQAVVEIGVTKFTRNSDEREVILTRLMKKYPNVFKRLSIYSQNRHLNEMRFYSRVELLAGMNESSAASNDDEYNLAIQPFRSLKNPFNINCELRIHV